MITQPMIIQKHLETYGHINPHEALDKYGVYRLSEVIRKLRHKGLHIDTVMKETTTKMGINTQYGEYILRGGNDEQ